MVQFYWMSDRCFEMRSLAADVAEAGRSPGKLDELCWKDGLVKFSRQLCLSTVGQHFFLVQNERTVICFPSALSAVVPQPVLSFMKMFSLDCVPFVLFNLFCLFPFGPP